MKKTWTFKYFSGKRFIFPNFSIIGYESYKKSSIQNLKFQGGVRPHVYKKHINPITKRCKLDWEQHMEFN